MIWNFLFFVGGYHHGYAAAAPAAHVLGVHAGATPLVGGYGGYGVSKVVTPAVASVAAPVYGGYSTGYGAAYGAGYGVSKVVTPAVYGGYAAHGMLSVY